MLDALDKQDGFDPKLAITAINNLKPGTELTRNTMAKILCSAATGCDPNNDPVGFLEDKGITVGRDPARVRGECQRMGNNNCFDGKSKMTNGQMVTFLARTLDAVGTPDGDPGYHPPSDTTVTTTTTTVPPRDGTPPVVVCPSNYSVMSAHVSATDNGCRPTTCPLGRDTRGRCIQPPWQVQNLTTNCTVNSGSLRLDIDWDQPASGPFVRKYQAQLYTGTQMQDTQWFFSIRGRRVAERDIYSTTKATFPPRWTNAYKSSLAWGETYRVRIRPVADTDGVWSHASDTCPSLPSVSLTSTALTVDETEQVTISASLDEAPSGTASVRFTVSGATNGNGSCSTGADFYVSGTQFTFANTDSASITLTACDDTDTTDETVTLELTTTGINGLQLGTPTTVTVTITDDDTERPKFLS